MSPASDEPNRVAPSSIPSNSDADPWNDRHRPALRIHEVLRNTATVHPERISLVDRDSRLSYRELEQDVGRVADLLAEGGVSDGARVATTVGNGRVGITLMYALSSIGAVAVPINEFWTPREVADALRRGECSFVLCDQPRPIDAWRAALDSAEQPRFGLMSDVAALHWDGPRGERLVSAGHDPDVAMLLFTSGSTASPKGALVTHQGLVGVAHYVGLTAGLCADDRFLQLLPLYHVGGIANGFLVPHLVGAVCLPLRFEADAVLSLFEREKVTATAAFDSMLETLRASPHYAPSRLASWRVALTSGTTLTYDRLRAAGVPVIASGFGLTECSGDIATTRMTQPEEERRSACWTPFPGVDVRIADPSSGHTLGPDEIGEIRVRGWGLLRGYIDGSTGLDEQGYFRTGDLGSLTALGHLRYSGREKDVIKSGGENVSAFEVESYLRSTVEAVAEVVIVGAPSRRWGETVVGFVEYRPGAALDADELRAVCREGLAAFKIPKHIIAVPPGEWPLLPAGKIDRGELRQRAASSVGDEPSADTHPHR